MPTFLGKWLEGHDPAAGAHHLGTQQRMKPNIGADVIRGFTGTDVCADCVLHVNFISPHEAGEIRTLYDPFHPLETAADNRQCHIRRDTAPNKAFEPALEARLVFRFLHQCARSLVNAFYARIV